MSPAKRRETVGERRLERLARPLLFAGGASLVALALGWDALGGSTRSDFGRGQQALLVVGLVALAVAALSARWSLRLAVAGAAAGAGLAALEAALELGFGEEFSTPFTVDAQALHALAPGAVHRFRHRPENGGHVVRTRVNSTGQRGGELRSDAELRVVVYGDSFVQAEYSEQEHTFTARLEALLADATGARVEVVNAGVVSYGPDQVFVRMERELAALRPDRLLLVLYAGNDFGDLVRNKLFALDAQGRLRRAHPELAPEQFDAFARASSRFVLPKLFARSTFWGDPQALERRLDDAVRRSAARGVALTPAEARVELWLEERTAEYEEAVVRGDPLVRNLLNDGYDADLSAEPDGPSARYKLALMRALIGEIAALARARATPLAVVVVPARVDVCTACSEARVSAALHPHYRRERLTGLLATLAAEHGLPVVDLFATFRDAGPESLYWRGGDDHWNDAGQALAAARVGQALLAERFFPGPRAVTARAGAPPAARSAQ